MLRRQESTFSSSSSRRHAVATSSPEARRTKAIGCMSGILRFFSRSHNSRRRITFGRNEDNKRKTISVDIIKKPEPPLGKSASPEKDAPEIEKVSRSPTITTEIRRSTAHSSAISCVTKLMGLNDVESSDTSPKSDDDPIEEKRRQLLQALAKCNEDLEALRKIIAAARYTIPPPPRTQSEEVPPACMEKSVVTSEEPNPPITSSAAKQNRGEEEEIMESSLKPERCVVSRPLWRSVEEVFQGVDLGEKVERMRLRKKVDEFVWRELIEELVFDLISLTLFHYSLPPRWACRRRLSF